MRLLSLSNFLALPLLFVFASCAKPEGGSGVHGQFNGVMSSEMSKILAPEQKEKLDACDVAHRDEITALSKALEERKQNFSKAVAQVNSSSSQKLRTLGSFHFIDDLDTPTDKDEWTVEHTSWKDIANQYNQLKDKPISSEWIQLNTWARSLVFNDSNRIESYVNMTVSRQRLPILLKALETVRVCESSPSCVTPAWSESEQAAVLLHRSYRENVLTSKDSKRSIAERRASVSELSEELAEDLAFVTFSKNPTIRVQGKTLIVPMDLSVFKNDVAKVTEILEKAWNKDPEYTIKVLPVDARTKAVKVKIDPPNGERAYVKLQNLEMQMFDYDELTAIIHEFGHVLGFPDEYYTTWNPQTCGYDVESNGGNIMSYQYTGRVLPEHWAQLKKQYFKN